MEINSRFNIDSDTDTEKFFDYSEFAQTYFNNSSPDKVLQNKDIDYIEIPMENSSYLVDISPKSQNYCVGLVDMVNSTKIAAMMNSTKMARYYQIFLNSMSKILTKFGGFVIKNVGDCLFYYFPESSKPERKSGFLSCLEGSLVMVELHDYVCQRLKNEGLPCVDYRVSADFGSVRTMRTNISSSIDMIGTPMNMCSKINHLAFSNKVVIGGDLYEVVKHFQDYNFKQVKACSVGFKYQYPVYSVTRKLTKVKI